MPRTEDAEWKDLPITGDPYRGVDEVQLSGVSAYVMDAYVDELEQTCKRPGLDLFVDFGTSYGVDGLYWWDRQRVAIGVSAGRVFQIDDFAGSVTELVGATLTIGTRVSYASDGTKLVMANGGRMVHCTKSGALTTMADADAPIRVSHVAYLDGYILANLLDTGLFHFCTNDDMTDWDAAEFAAAEGKPDTITALYEGWSEIALVGPESVEIWVNDGQTPFSRLSGGLIQEGCGAPHTFRQVGNAWMWLSKKRRFVQLTGRTPEPVSFPYDKIIQSFVTVDDAVADVMEIAGQCFYVVSFPSANRTFVYSVYRKAWHEWGYWNQSLADYQRWRGSAYCYAEPWGLHLVGDRASGKIYKMSREYFSDNGDLIRSVRRTGFNDHGTPQLKRSYEAIIRTKRGQGTASVPAPTMGVRWRDKPGAWKNGRSVSLGAVGEHEIYATLKGGLGTYRARQWELTHSANTDWILVGGRELVDVLPR
jgi:hypothetical protein